MKISHSSGLVDEQSVSLPGRPAPPSRPLRCGRGRAPCGRRCARPPPCTRLAGDVLALAGVLLEPLAELVVDDLLHERLRLGVAELGLGLALELRLAQLDDDDRGEALADVLAGEVVVLLLEDVPLAGELVDQRGERRAEALLVGAALVGVDRVGEGVAPTRCSRCSTASRPRRRHARRRCPRPRTSMTVRWTGPLRGVEVVDEVDDAALVVVDDLRVSVVVLDRVVLRRRSAEAGRSSVSAMVRPLLRNAISWKRRARACRSRTCGGLEDLAVGPEGDRGAGLVGGARP